MRRPSTSRAGPSGRSSFLYKVPEYVQSNIHDSKRVCCRRGRLPLTPRIGSMGSRLNI